MANLINVFETDSGALPLSDYVASLRTTKVHKFGEIHGRFGAHKQSASLLQIEDR